MEKLTIFKLTTALLLLLNTGTLVFLWLNRPQGPLGQSTPFELIVKETRMDPEQERQYALLRDEHRRQMEAFRSKNNALREQLYALLATPGQDSAQTERLMESIAGARREEERVTFEHFRQVRALCRPEQQRRFDDIIQEAVRRMGRPPRPPR